MIALIEPPREPPPDPRPEARPPSGHGEPKLSRTWLANLKPRTEAPHVPHRVRGNAQAETLGETLTLEAHRAGRGSWRPIEPALAMLSLCSFASRQVPEMADPCPARVAVRARPPRCRSRPSPR